MFYFTRKCLSALKSVPFILFIQLALLQSTFAEKLSNIIVDESGKYSIIVSHFENGELKLNLVDNSPTKSSANKSATLTIKEGVQVIVDGKPAEKIKESNGTLTFKWSPSGSAPTIQIYNRRIARLSAESRTGQLRTRKDGLLTVFDLKELGKQGIHYGKAMPGNLSANEVSALRSPVDLHTHFGGAMRSSEIIRIAFKHEIPFNVSFLDRLGIQYPVEYKGQKMIPLKQSFFTPQDIGKLKSALEFPITDVETMREMETIYEYRGPLVKFGPALPDYLESLAADYKARGVKLALLSVSDILRPEWLAEIHKYLPSLEKKFGVNIRFLAGFWRHSPAEFNMDLLRKMEVLLTSPYIAGVDWMGHETNSTKAIEDQIKFAKEIFDRNQIKDAVIQAHAGENPLFPGNIREALAAGANHIGHGLYGVTPEVFRLAGERKAVMEMQLVSNVTLNNATTESNLPIPEYLRNGNAIAFNSDGHGLYQDTPIAQLYGALYSGISLADIKATKAGMVKYIEVQNASFAERLAKNPNLTIPTTFPAPKFSNGGWNKIGEIAEQNKKLLAETLTAEGVKVHASIDDFVKSVQGMKPIGFSMASMISWGKISNSEKQEMVSLIRENLRHIDPTKHYYMTRGADYPGEKILHDEIVLYNKEAQELGKPQIRVVGFWPSENKGIVYPIGKTTDAVIAASWWYDLSAVAVDFIKKQNGLMVFVGGGDILNNEIQAAKNADVKFLVAKGPEGAANEAAKIYPDHAFEGSSGFLDKLKSSPELKEFLSAEAQRSPIGKKLWSDNRSLIRIDGDGAIEAIKRKYKRVISFGGNSTQGFEDEKAVEAAIAGELSKYDPRHVVINGPGSEPGIGIMNKVAKRMGFKVIGIISSEWGDPSFISPFVDEVYIINDKMSGGADPATKQLSPTSKTIVEVSEAYLAFSGGSITATEYEWAEKAGKRVKFHSIEKNRKNAIYNFVRQQRKAILDSISGKVRAYGDTLVDIALISIAETAYDGKEFNEAKFAETVKAIDFRAKGYDFPDSLEVSRSILKLAVAKYQSLDSNQIFNYFSHYGTAQASIMNRKVARCESFYGVKK